MFRKTQSFHKFILIALLLVLILTTVLVSTVSAAGSPQGNPPPAQGQNQNARLERAYQQVERRLTREGRLLNRSDNLVQKAQTLIDHARAKGLDVTIVQSALDKLVTVLPDVKSAYAKAAAIAAEHKGFDAQGNVTDPQAARSTLEELRAAMKATRDAADGAFKGLVQAVKDFRQTNRAILHPQKSVTPAP